MSLIWANLVQTLLCMGLVILIFSLLEKPIKNLLDELVGFAAATTFYTRVLALVLLLVGLKRSVLLINKPDDAWGSTWTLMSNWNDVMEPATVVLLVFAGLITILVAVLRRAHDR